MAELLELINRRERQILVHSCIYYIYNDNIISDDTWTEWAKELEDLIHNYPDIFEQSVLKDRFRDFDHSTGFNLEMKDPWTMSRAYHLLQNKYDGIV